MQTTIRQGLAVVLAVAVWAAPLAASARDVYLNGVKLGPDVVITNQTFPACEVKFDEKGNVWITAKGYQIDLKPTDGKAKDKDGKAKDGKAKPQPAAKLEKRYWLISQQPSKGKAQYDIDVFINGKHVKKVRSSDDPVILEVTKYVRPGDNVVQLVAKKNMGDKRLSSSAADTLEVVIGEGDVGGGTVSITRPVVTYVRTANETKSYSDQTSFEGR